MPKNTTVSCPAGVPTRLTDDAVAAARVVGSQDFHLCATTGPTPPASTDGSVMLLPWSVLAADLALADLFPGVGESVHLWAWPKSGNVDVSVSHG
ncbi:MAG: hypothetical protein CSA74_11640 [Rhodobacterales bacterium]|nr:MAG: hypothetical protein CSA74_11640 [Rhodobacterales bacterium]